MKLYPFSVQKHAHDIEFRINRTRCLMYDMESGETAMDGKTYDRMVDMLDNLQDLMDIIMNSNGRVAYLTGPQIALAKETVIWASNTRANSLIEAGKTQYLKYL